MSRYQVKKQRKLDARQQRLGQIERLYRNATPAEREEIIRELGRLRSEYNEGKPLRDRFEADVKALQAMPEGEERYKAGLQLKTTYQPFADLLGPFKVPTPIAACGKCERPTRSCICLDATGQPFNWSSVPANPQRFAELRAEDEAQRMKVLAEQGPSAMVG